jgi:hypothetical protein
MKKQYLLKVTCMFVYLACLLIIAGCSSSDKIVLVAVDTPAPTANVVVQLTVAGSTPYLVDRMSVSIQTAGGPVLTVATGTDGIARIPVTEIGDYEVIKVEGVDATNLLEGSEAGREFKKENPIANPYPNLTYTFGGSFPTVSVTALGSDYTVNADVPIIIKVTVLKVGSFIGTEGTDVIAGTAAFAGRVMLSNFTCTGQPARMGIQSDAVYNRLMLSFDTSAPVSGVFRGNGSTVNIGTFGSYLPASWIYFEAPGTDSGDWALGYILNTLITREDLGGSSSDYNFPLFDGGDTPHFVLRQATISVESYDYRIFQFDEYPGPTDGIE